MTRIKLLLIGVLVIAFGSGCTVKSKEDEMSKVAQTAERAFEQDKMETTVDFNGFSLYLPNKFEVVEEGSSNFILQKGDQVYILFHNPLEDSKSQVNLDTTIENSNYSLLKTFDAKDKFGYVLALPRNEDEFELQIGVGGVKLTTITSLHNLEKDAEVMMQMANSLSYQSEVQ
ncbi:hypothetical protein [Aquibacillus salsiterrae]|uniref:Uncharacterized protein n=1 Tax=Aquibacillus salsiterrae TaxID=2950439 RepID=A0A9X4ADU0_9BACI|nr:hypothetical protein [Aquibacillus salsiterrae]MDC3415942.1 hypothetical protein [Aquibacillus salsiterrae]